MRVAFVSHSAERAGAEQSMVALIGVMLLRDHIVEVWLPRDGPLRRDLIGVGVPPGSIRFGSNHWWMSRRGWGLVGLVRLVQVLIDTASFIARLRRNRPEVLVVNSSVAPAALIAGHVLGIPTVTIIRESLRTNPTLRSILPKTWIAAVIARCSRRVVVISEYVYRQFCEGLTSELDFGVIPSPVVITEHVRTDVLPRESRPEGGPLHLLMLGTIGGDKGQLDAIEATAMALSNGADVRLDMYGRGSSDAVSEVGAAILSTGWTDEIGLHDAVKDVRPLLARADVLIMASKNEAFGRVTVEALEAGLPVVGYDAGATSEILAQGGGILVAPTSTAMAEAIESLASHADLLSQKTEEAQEAGQRWSASRTDEEFVDLVEQVLAEHVRLSS